MKKNQVLSLTLFALMTLASVKTASSAPPHSAQADAPAGTEISLGDFLCNLSQTKATALPGSIPVPTPASKTGVCGYCSQGICRGRTVGITCVYQGIPGPGTCSPTYTCPADGSPQCQCLPNWS